MENEKNPMQEELVPQDLPQIPEEMEELEVLPVIEDIPFVEEAPLPEELPQEVRAPAEEPAEPEEAAPDAVCADAEAPADAPSFMEGIPDAEEAPAGPVLTDPQLHQEIIPDDRAMDFHGMLEHGEEEPPFDMNILSDPAFEEPAPAEPEEEINDQEYRDNGKDFDELFAAAEAKHQHPIYAHLPHKGRPKRKKGEGLLGIPSILVTFVWLALILAIGTTLGRMIWVCAADVLAFGREDKAVTVTIYEADSMEDITNKLYEKGLIRYRSLFSLYAGISNAEEDIQPGIYDLNTRYDYHALVNFMSPRSSREVIKVTIPEGYTCRQIFSLLEENRICTAVDAGAYAANGELSDYWFLEGLERGSENSLEGYLFPDTYEFYKNSTPREALEKMLDNFEYRFSEEMRGHLETLNANVTGGTFGIREVVIVASLIEKESAAPGESPNIAGVIYNRLFKWGSTPPYLNIDASIVYAQEGATDHIDTSIDSPYNTYTNTGLTPGPISNPGLSSLQAALAPESHNYYYYVLNPSTGMHQFSTTYEEHSGYVTRFAEGS